MGVVLNSDFNLNFAGIQPKDDDVHCGVHHPHHHHHSHRHRHVLQGEIFESPCGLWFNSNTFQMKEMQKDGKRISVRNEDERRAEKVLRDISFLIFSFFLPAILVHVGCDILCLRLHLHAGLLCQDGE